jgi:hypothetical protein
MTDGNKNLPPPRQRLPALPTVENTPTCKNLPHPTAKSHVKKSQTRAIVS